MSREMGERFGRLSVGCEVDGGAVRAAPEGCFSMWTEMGGGDVCDGVHGSGRGAMHGVWELKAIRMGD